jgi:hypothetical protein
MFSAFFGSKKELKDVEELEEEKDLSEIFINPIESQHHISYYFIECRKIGRYLSSWCFNRKIDIEHKEKIKKDLKNQKNYHLMGTIQLIRDLKKQIRVVNGQHRLKAIEEILIDDIDNKFTMKIMFELYDLSIIDLCDPSDKEQELIEEVFETANKSLAMKFDNNHHDIFCKEIMKKLCKDNVLKNGIVDTDGKVYKSRISKKEFFEKIKEYLNCNLGLSSDQIIIRMKQINSQIKMMDNITLFGRDKPSQGFAHEHGFYLNIDDYYACPEKWLKDI